MKDILFLLNILYLGKVSCICESTSSDVCKLNQNTDLPHVYTRHPSIDYSAQTDDTKYCDLHALQHGTWYRSSYNLITECVDHRKCGTSDPIWLNGSLPADSDGTVDGTGCVRTFDSCCESTLGLKIRNCTYYMVYCFIDLHSACHSRYCLDTDLSIETTTTATTTTTTTTTTAPATTDNSKNGENIISDNPSTYKGAFIAVTVLLLFGVVVVILSPAVVAFAGYTVNVHKKSSQVSDSRMSLKSEQDKSTRQHVTEDVEHNKTSQLNDTRSQLSRSPVSVVEIQTNGLH
ncbi:uncharacterized protein LOC128554125 [Mercenaria mercenaria]|uniref:uncharacterized protein LOC128554125 n=1 Tax=Mercenaria mercenaria TaxID=6596 RepID=UPI00234FB13E|nr:uncharacterized protein LOC128554125 [Mercenaria mercenaria]